MVDRGLHRRHAPNVDFPIAFEGRDFSEHCRSDSRRSAISAFTGWRGFFPRRSMAIGRMAIIFQEGGFFFNSLSSAAWRSMMTRRSAGRPALPLRFDFGRLAISL